MPNKFVFPGGAVEDTDSEIKLADLPPAKCLQKLNKKVNRNLSETLLACAIREVWEETGIRLARINQAKPIELPPNWLSFAEGGYQPSAKHLFFIYRAITPPGQTRRFDARFFLAELDQVDLVGDPDDFSKASPELSNLQWIPLSDASTLDVPTITRTILNTITKLLPLSSSPNQVPFKYYYHQQYITEWL